MSPKVLDVLLVKRIEREIKRKLDESELDALRHGETIYHQKPNGLVVSYTVPSYVFPQQLMVNEADLALSQNSFWDHAFNNGPVVEQKVEDRRLFQ